MTEIYTLNDKNLLYTSTTYQDNFITHFIHLGTKDQ